MMEEAAAAGVDGYRFARRIFRQGLRRAYEPQLSRFRKNFSKRSGCDAHFLVTIDSTLRFHRAPAASISVENGLPVEKLGSCGLAIRGSYFS